MAERGLRAVSVPSARAGQQTDPTLRRDAFAGLMTGGFLMAVIAIALAIVLAAPQYAEPASAADPATDLQTVSAEAESEDEAIAFEALPEPESKRPGKLRGYRWPVRGGMVDTYFEHDSRGIVEIEGKRIHDGLLITWFEGATVKAAHEGTVVAAGRDWARHTGFYDSLDGVYARYADGNGKKSGKPAFPQGIVVDDGNGYYSVYSELKGLQVKPGDKVKPGQPIGRMTVAEGRNGMMRYRLIRMDGKPMRVSEAARDKGYSDYARERINPLAVLNLKATKAPKLPGKPKQLLHLSGRRHQASSMRQWLQVSTGSWTPGQRSPTGQPRSSISTSIVGCWPSSRVMSRSPRCPATRSGVPR